MSRNEHGAYGPRYEVGGAPQQPGPQRSTQPPTSPPTPYQTPPMTPGDSVAGGSTFAPPYAGPDDPMAQAPHVARPASRVASQVPSIPVGLAGFAVLLGVLAMIWPTVRLRQELVTGESSVSLVHSQWIHGAISFRGPDGSDGHLLAIGLVAFIVTLLVALCGAAVAWVGRSVRADAFGILGSALQGGVFLLPSIMALGTIVTSSGGRVDMTVEYGAGVWLGMASGILGLVAATLFCVRLGRDANRLVRN